MSTLILADTSIIADLLQQRSHQENNCVLWDGAVGSHGYGAIRINKKVHLAHRVAFIISKGEIPQGKVLMHLCNNKLCINPDHLKLGTDAENLQHAYDTSQRKQVSKGCRLMRQQAEEIREKYKSGKYLQKDLALEYGISEGYISNIIHFRAWK